MIHAGVNLAKTWDESSIQERNFQAYLLAAPVVLMLHTGGELDHCAAASVAGTAVLEQIGIAASAVPCGLVLETPDRIHSVGLTGPDLRQLLPTDALARIDGLEDACDVQDPEVPAMHVVIEAYLGGSRAIVDPTFGQLINQGANVPVQMVVYNPVGWPTVTLETSIFRYFDSPRAASLSSILKKMQVGALFDDIRKLMGYALQHENDESSFDGLLRGNTKLKALNVGRHLDFLQGRRICEIT